MATFSLHIHHMDLKDQLNAFYTKERFMFTGLLGLFMSFVTLIGNIVLTIEYTLRCLLRAPARLTILGTILAIFDPFGTPN